MIITYRAGYPCCNTRACCSAQAKGGHAIQGEASYHNTIPQLRTWKHPTTPNQPGLEPSSRRFWATPPQKGKEQGLLRPRCLRCSPHPPPPPPLSSSPPASALSTTAPPPRSTSSRRAGRPARARPRAPR